MRRRCFVAAASTLALAGLLRGARADEGELDVLLVLAADVSRSVDEDEARLQREGYYAGISHPQVIEAIQAGGAGCIGVAFVEWSGEEDQQLLAPWTRISGLEDAQGWAAGLQRHPPRARGWTSISGAIQFSRNLVASSPWQAARRVIDISGDGVNNSGPPPEAARDAALADGIVLNGLPILTDAPIPGGIPLDEYYRQSVIGGPGAFVSPAQDFTTFAQALRRKLILEIAGIEVPGGTARG